MVSCKFFYEYEENCKNVRRLSSSGRYHLEGFILKVVLVKECEVRTDHRDLTITALNSEVSWIC